VRQKASWASLTCCTH